MCRHYSHFLFAGVLAVAGCAPPTGVRDPGPIGTVAEDPASRTEATSLKTASGAPAKAVGEAAPANSTGTVVGQGEQVEDVALPPAVASPVSDNPADYGQFPPTPAGLNDQTRSVADALKTKGHPERLSPLVSPRPFDAASFARNPKLYLDVVEPGRVFQSAQPGAGVSRIEIVGEQLRNLTQGQSTILTVRAVAGMPVSLTSFDGGRFSNGLTAATVLADKAGLASTRFDATSGTINEVQVLASCPVTAGQVRFTIVVSK